MPDSTKTLMGGIYTHLRSLDIEDYLASGQFSLFLKNQDLEDAWKQFLVESEDRPDLYGNDVGKNTFTLFLLHVFHRHHEEFPVIMGDFFCSISKWSSHLLPVVKLKRDLQNLGYSDRDIDAIFLGNVST
jgi:hypothetical protein